MKLTLKEENARLKAGMKDLAEYSPYTEGKRYAAHVLDYSTPLQLSTPVRLTGKVGKEYQLNT